MTHAELVVIAERWLRNTRRCHVVLTEHHGGTLEIPDAIGFQCGWPVQIECKASLADFRADRKKPCRRPEYALASERWYLAPKGLVPIAELPGGWGLLERDMVKRRTVIARPAERLPLTDAHWRNSVTRLCMELRRYQAQGIRYKTVSELLADGQPRP